MKKATERIRLTDCKISDTKSYSYDQRGHRNAVKLKGPPPIDQW